ncbi:MAG: carboxy terminal-processing peptidase [Planctomycetota bacterium]
MRRLTESSRKSSSRGWLAAFAAPLLFGSLFTASLRAELLTPTRDDRLVSMQIAGLLEHIHIRRGRLDDTMSKRFFQSYLDVLDPLKVYFYASDVKEFRRDETRLDDDLKAGKLDFAYRVFNRFLERVDERVEVATKLLKEDHDFSVDEYFSSDRKEAEYPGDRKEMDEIWRRRIKLLLLEKISGEVELEKARDQLLKRYSRLQKSMHKTDKPELLQMYFTAATTTFDPHTTYLSPSTLETFEINMRLELEGIGAALRSIDGETVVSEIIPGGAADRDGRLQPEDIITEVAQGKEGGEWLDIYDMKLSDVVQHIRGKKGTRVRLKIRRKAKVEEISLERAKVELKYSEAHGEVFDLESSSNAKKRLKVGVIDLPSFYMDMEAAGLGKKDFRSSTRDVLKLIEKFKEEKVDAVVVDLRRNGGGALTEAINMTGLFIDQGPIVQVKGPTGGVDTKVDSDPSVAWDGPLVVVTSKFSASASEIFAGAIKDYGRGLIVGDHATHGKGTVQHLLNLGDRQLGGEGKKLGALKITISQFYRPTGESTQNRGVEPHLELPSVTNHLEIGEATLDNAIAFDRIKPADFKKLGRVSGSLIAQIKKRSEKRVLADEEFKKVEEEIERYLKFKDRKKIPLQKKKFLSDYKREQDESTKATSDDNENSAGSSLDRKILRDYYMNEILAITTDLVVTNTK